MFQAENTLVIQAGRHSQGVSKRILKNVCEHCLVMAGVGGAACSALSRGAPGTRSVPLTVSAFDTAVAAALWI